jgi:hypothetical protein
MPSGESLVLALVLKANAAQWNGRARVRVYYPKKALCLIRPY